MKRHWIYDIPITAKFLINDVEVTKEEYMSAQKVKLDKHLAKYFPEELEKGA